METKTIIAKAIIKVMQAVKSIDKGMTIGTGTSAYQGVSDKDVKLAIGKAMEDNGLTILPIGIEAKTQIDRWDETNQYGTKTKQSVFTEVKTRYLLLHESGESIELEGYGHGVDSQDKSAGKATTYALKNTLLYMFLVPTGKIEDTDNDHSDDKPVPQNKPTAKVVKTELFPNSKAWTSALDYLQKPGAKLEILLNHHTITDANKELLLEQASEVVSA